MSRRIPSIDPLLARITREVAAIDFSGYTIQYPPLLAWGPVAPARVLDAWERIALRPGPAGLYVHLPFCEQRCTYCRYGSRQGDPAAAAAYLLRLEAEAARYAAVLRPRSFTSLYLGGGTPTLAGAEPLRRLFATLHRLFRFAPDAQRTVEATPATVSAPVAAALAEAGVDRVTLGVQSLDRGVLRLAQRHQPPGSVRRAVDRLRAAGIRHLNIDLLAGLPGQSVASLERSLDGVMALSPDQVHVHTFYPTPDTGFARQGGRLGPADRERRDALRAAASRRLGGAGFGPSPFDAPARVPQAGNRQLAEAIDPVAPFLGLGAGAMSCATGELRHGNPPDPDRWAARLARGRLPVHLGLATSIEEDVRYYLMATLRYGATSRRRFRALFGGEPEAWCGPEIAYLVERGVLESTRDALVWRAPGVGAHAVLSKYLYSPRVLARCRRRLGLGPADGEGRWSLRRFGAIEL